MIEIDTKVQEFSKDLRDALLEAGDLLDRLDHGDAWAALCRDRRRVECPVSLDVYFGKHDHKLAPSDDTDSDMCTAGSSTRPKGVQYDHFASLDSQSKKQYIQAYLQAQGSA